jgi:hypothetical protein
MSQPTDPLEVMWDHLLSREPERIQVAFAALNAAERVNILAHLHRMAEEEGWHPEQRASALAALKALKASGAGQKLSARKSQRHK